MRKVRTCTCFWQPNREPIRSGAVSPRDGYFKGAREMQSGLGNKEQKNANRRNFRTHIPCGIAAESCLPVMIPRDAPVNGQRAMVKPKGDLWPGYCKVGSTDRERAANSCSPRAKQKG